MRTSVVAAASFILLAGSAQAQDKPKEIEFELTAIAAVIPCLSADGVSYPKAHVKVRRGDLNDRLSIEVKGLKPDLQFDLFTVQRSPLDANGNPISPFKGFGLAWYQTDLDANDSGKADARIRTILLDQIFGFDGDKRDDGTTTLPPTNTFHVGFWFNNPEDAASCGFDVTKPTPFNGEHRAGPLAMISKPDPNTGLGPLCTSPTGADPDSPSPQACNP